METQFIYPPIAIGNPLRNLGKFPIEREQTRRYSRYDVPGPSAIS